METTSSSKSSGIAVSDVRAVVEEHFPGLWPAVDAGLSVCATLLLEDNSNPLALIYVGPAASGKTTVADMFADYPLCYRSDNFTPASFVSHAANIKRDELAAVDLLPRIQHKVLVTPELAPIFRGKQDDLVRQFAVLTRVLDGHGLKTDSGNHGQRGYAGDYLFSCLGCTTPFDEKVWDTMAQLGSRLFFLTMEAKQAATTEALVAALQGTPYKEQLGICQRYVTEFFSPHKGRCPEHGQDGCPARSVQWNKEKDSGAVLVWIARMAELVAAMRVCRRRKRSSAKVTLRVNPILNRAMEWKYLKANPAHGVRGAKEAPGRVRYLSAEERDTLLNGADVTVKAKDGRTWTVRRVPNPALRLYILAALQTGARRGEVLALRWADVDMKARVLTFRQTKNGESRTVPITDTLREALLALPRPLKSEASVFPERDPKVLSRAFARLVKELKLPNLRFHDLRHDAASTMTMAAVPQRTVMAMLGHRDPRMTMRYQHLTPDHLHDAARALNSPATETLAARKDQAR